MNVVISSQQSSSLVRVVMLLQHVRGQGCTSSTHFSSYPWTFLGADAAVMKTTQYWAVFEIPIATDVKCFHCTVHQNHNTVY